MPMPDSREHIRIRWSGSDEAHLGAPHIRECGSVAIGCYGGNIEAGAERNEDAAIVFSDGANWTFAGLLDGHNSSESPNAVLDELASAEERIADLLQGPVEQLETLKAEIIALLSSETFLHRCRGLSGETACLICAQKEQFLWWISVGDNLVYNFHPELAQLGQFALNQRSYFEWVGRVNTFDLAIPCFASGTRELRTGQNTILMVTDGLLEAGSRAYEDPKLLYREMTLGESEGKDLRTRVAELLERVHIERGEDSASVVAWECVGAANPAYPSD